MQIKQNTQYQLKLKWAVPIAVILFVGSIFLSLQMGKEHVVYVPETIHPAPEMLSLSAVPALAGDVNLYNEDSVVSVDSGFVRVTHPDGRDEDINTQSPVNSGDRILVSEEGNAEILWFDGSITRLSAGTDIRILQASYDSNNINKTKISLWANRGKIWAKVVNLIDGESEFLIESTNAIAGVRGTTFNYILEDSVPTVEVIESKVFLKKITDYTSEEILMDITRGQTGIIKKDGTMEVKAFNPEKLSEPYYAQNLEKDVQADKKLREVTLLKIRQFAQPLPGDPDYPKKQELIQKLLSETKDPVLLDRLEARAEKIKMYEAIATSSPESVQTTLSDIGDKINSAELREAKRSEIQNYLNNNLKNIERALNQNSEEATDVNKMKDVIIEGQTRAENEVQKREPAIGSETKARRADEKTNLLPVSKEKIINSNLDKAPQSEVAEPKQTEKPVENIIKVAPAKQVIQPARIYYPKKTSSAPVADPAEKNEEVLKKIEASREIRAEKIEVKRLKEVEIQNVIQEETKNENGSPDEIEKTGASQISPEENIISSDIKTIKINEVSTDKTGETEKTKPKEDKVQSGSPSTQPKEDSTGSSVGQQENKGQTETQTTQPSENGTGTTNIQKEECGQTSAPTAQPQENNVQQTSPDPTTH